MRERHFVSVSDCWAVTGSKTDTFATESSFPSGKAELYENRQIFSCFQELIRLAMSVEYHN